MNEVRDASPARHLVSDRVGRGGPKCAAICGTGIGPLHGGESWAHGRGPSEDQVWASATQAQRIMQRLDDARAPAHQALVYPDAGHGVGSFPYLAAGTSAISAASAVAKSRGGTREADAAARSDAWPKVLAFLAS